MTWSSGPRAVAAAIWFAFAAGIGDAPAQTPGRSVTLNDTAARIHLETMEKAGILSEPVWAHAYWARSTTAPTREARIADLRWALRFDPDLTAARWDLCWTLLENRDPEFATEAVRAVSGSMQSFVSQQRAIAWVLTILAGALALGLISISAILIGNTARPIHHGVRERLHFLPAELRAGAAWLTILVPLVLVLTLAPTAALFWGLLIGTVGAWVHLASWQRRTCVSALVVVLLAPTGLALWTRIMEPAFPTSYLRNLWATQRMGGEVLPPGWWAAAPDDVGEDPDFLASLALVERRAGRYDDAVAHLQNAIQLRPDAWHYLNNLGNVHLLRGDSDAALSAYDDALQIAPKEPLIWVNVAQAHVQRLEFNEADQSLAQAIDLGYRLPPVLNDESTGIIVRDHALSSAQLWQRFLRGEGLGRTLEWRRVLAMTLSPIFPMRPFWLSLPLLLTLYYALHTRTLPRVFPCSSCGRSICRKCHYRRLRRSVCPDCYALRQDVNAPMKRDAMIAARRVSVNRGARITTAVLSALLPGSGLLLLGSYRRALLFLIAPGRRRSSCRFSASLSWPSCP
jgi:tetratricopeptide (TPR) repeat protein